MHLSLPVLAGKSLACFPCNFEKRPATPHSFKDATSKYEAVAELFGRYPGELIGVPTGKISGFDILDIDPRNRGHNWLRENVDHLPPTRMHETRSGGYHFFFEHSDGLRCSTGRLAPGVDVRADGGYIIWWPAHGLSILEESSLAPWPEWLLIQLQRKSAPRKTMGVSSATFTKETPISARLSLRERRYATAALRNAMQELIDAKRGTRNQKLNALAFKMGRLIAPGWIDAAQVVRGLEAAAWSCGLETDDGLAQVRATIKSGLEAGMAKPYTDLPDWAAQ